MKLKEIQEIPNRYAQRKNVQRFIEDFYNGPINIAQVEFSNKDYKNVASCYSSLHVATKRSKYPVKAVLRGDEVYLVKKLKESE